MQYYVSNTYSFLYLCCWSRDNLFVFAAEKSVSRALDLRPGFCDALYVRSRVAREQGKLEAALVDVIDAERYATPRSLREIRRLKQKILEESERQEEK